MLLVEHLFYFFYIFFFVALLNHSASRYMRVDGAGTSDLGRETASVYTLSFVAMQRVQTETALGVGDGPEPHSR